jgi:hypothetical protein
MWQLQMEAKYLLIASATSFALPLLSVWILSWRYRRHSSASWPERARMLWPARVAANLLVLTVPVIFTIVPFSDARHGQPLLHPLTIWVFCYVAALQAIFLTRRNFPLSALSFGEFWKRWFSEQTLLLAPYLTAGVGALLSDAAWTRGSTWLVIVITLLIVAHAFGCLRLMRLLKLATAPRPSLNSVARRSIE